MARAEALQFLVAARNSAAMRTHYAGRNLAQLLFHAKSDGYSFTADDLADVVGRLEANVIVAKDEEQFDGSSRLWRNMWGCTHFEYVIDHLIERHTEEEMASLFATDRREAR